MHVLMGTLALVAGCSTAHQTEVSGVVRDRATGRVIPGARVVGADGSLAETDADGRFHLYVDGALVDVRISAAGHASEHVEIAGLEASVELAPIDESWGALDTHAHVVDFVEETWAFDASVGDASVAMQGCTETSLAGAHAALACTSCHGDATPTRACTVCHADEARAIEGAVPRAEIAPHAGLGGGCLACHGESASHGDATSACARCHGARATTLRADLGRFFALATTRSADPASGATHFEMQPTLDVVRWRSALADDGSRGAHDPRTVITLARAAASP